MLSQVDQKFPLGRSAQVRSHLCILIQTVIVCSDQCSGFLTSKLVLAFFKTSCVLVTETNKQTNKQKNSSQRQKLPAGSISVLGVCVLKLVFLATPLGVSCSPFLSSPCPYFLLPSLLTPVSLPPSRSLSLCLPLSFLFFFYSIYLFGCTRS